MTTLMTTQKNADKKYDGVKHKDYTKYVNEDAMTTTDYVMTRTKPT